MWHVQDITIICLSYVWLPQHTWRNPNVLPGYCVPKLRQLPQYLWFLLWAQQTSKCRGSALGNSLSIPQLSFLPANDRGNNQFTYKGLKSVITVNSVSYSEIEMLQWGKEYQTFELQVYFAHINSNMLSLSHFVAKISTWWNTPNYQKY